MLQVSFGMASDDDYSISVVNKKSMKLLYNFICRNRVLAELKMRQRLNFEEDRTFISFDDTCGAFFQIKLFEAYLFLHESVYVFTSSVSIKVDTKVITYLYRLVCEL